MLEVPKGTLLPGPGAGRRRHRPGRVHLAADRALDAARARGDPRAHDAADRRRRVDLRRAAVHALGAEPGAAARSAWSWSCAGRRSWARTSKDALREALRPARPTYPLRPGPGARRRARASSRRRAVRSSRLGDESRAPRTRATPAAVGHFAAVHEAAAVSALALTLSLTLRRPILPIGLRIGPGLAAAIGVCIMAAAGDIHWGDVRRGRSTCSGGRSSPWRRSWS